MLIRDLSSNDTGVNYAMYDAFIIRAVRETGAIDSSLATHIAGAGKKPFGLYVYANFQTDINQQINAINALVNQYKPTLKTAIDVEQDSYANAVIPPNIKAWIKTFLDAVPNSILYCNRDMLNNYLGAFRPGTDLWVAIPGGNLPQNFAGYNTIGVQFNSPDGSEDLSYFTEEVQISMTTLTIEQIQADLNTIGGYGLSVDGIQGPITTAAIKDFQSKHGLTVDGVAGPLTCAAIVAALNAPIPQPAPIPVPVPTPQPVPVPEPVVVPPAPDPVPPVASDEVPPVIPQPVIEPVAEPVEPVEPVASPIIKPVISEVKQKTLIDLIIEIFAAFIKTFKK